MFLLIGFEAMLIVEHVVADLGNRRERLEPVVWDTKSRRRAEWHRTVPTVHSGGL